MLNKPDITPRARNTETNKSALYRRTILASLLVSIGGMIAFVVWTLPSLTQHTADGATFLTSVIAFAPTFFVMATLLLACIVWWLMTERRTAPTNHTHTSSNLPTDTSSNNRIAPDASTMTGSSATSQRHYTRRISAKTLRERRKQQFSTGREYRGKVRKPALAQLNDEFANSITTPATTEEEAPATPAAKLVDPPVSEADNAPDATLSDITAITTSHTDSILSSSIASSIPAQFAPSSAYGTVPMPAAQAPISIFLLKEVTIEIQNDRGEKRAIQLRRKRRDDGRYIERDLLAYLASWRGQPVGRDKLLEAVFAYGLSDEKYSLTNLTNQFNKCTQFLRKDINQVAEELGIPELTVIASYRDEWRLLSEECRVVDLNEVERLYAKLKELAGEDFLKPDIQEVCQALIDIYRGDFCEYYIEDTVREGGQDWVNNWMRDPYTAYRDKYFHALWYRAEYWRVKADLCSDKSEAERTLQRNWYELAAKLYQDYALHVPTNFTNESAMLFDSKVSQRISLGERALRACLDMYTATRNTQAGDAAYLTFARRMGTLMQGRWKPRADTIEAWKNVREQTKSHRFAPRVMPHDLPREEIDTI